MSTTHELLSSMASRREGSDNSRSARLQRAAGVCAGRADRGVRRAQREVVGSGEPCRPGVRGGALGRDRGPEKTAVKGRLGRMLRTLRCSGRGPGRISSPSRRGPDDAHLRLPSGSRVTRCAKAGASSTALALSGSAVMTLTVAVSATMRPQTHQPQAGPVVVMCMAPGLPAPLYERGGHDWAGQALADFLEGLEPGRGNDQLAWPLPCPASHRPVRSSSAPGSGAAAGSSAVSGPACGRSGRSCVKLCPFRYQREGS